MNNKFYLFYDNDMFQKNLFGDFMDKEYISMYSSCRIEKGIKRILEKICTSVKINSIVSIPMQHYFYSIFDLDIDHNCNNIFIFTTESILRMSAKFLNVYKEKNHVKYILIILDSFHAHTKTFKMVIDKINRINFDKIYTYDKYDAEEFGYEYMGLCYYSKHDIGCDPIIYDLYYVGGIKGGRKELTEKISEKLVSGKLKCKFDVYYDKACKEKKANINYTNKWLEYTEVLSNVCKANCILEILQIGQRTQSIRYFEAICYNKKLLTNNVNVRNLPFYDERYIKILTDIDNIDYEWIKKRENIDYGYKGEFSPINFLKKCEEYGL